jgi:alcohol dehydrogenase
MKAAIYRAFRAPLTIESLPDPAPAADGVVIQVQANGLCRSDWHGWMGHDPDVRLPHVPGHELAGVVAAVGAQVTRWRVGDRVTVPFVCACGRCSQCLSGNQQVCDNQFQPGFTHWGAFAEYVAIDRADLNLVRLPDALDFVTAASLGCRFATAYRAVIAQGRVTAGQWVAVHGCGGVGLSAVMIAAAAGALVVAVDIKPENLVLAQSLGATAVVQAGDGVDVVTAVRDLTHGGAHLSLDALGSPTTCFNSVANLRKRGRHVQVGLLVGENRHTAVPMDQVVAQELEIVGSHGMQAHHYEEMLALIQAGRLQPQALIGKTATLEQGAAELIQMDRFGSVGVTVINQF